MLPLLILAALGGGVYLYERSGSSSTSSGGPAASTSSTASIEHAVKIAVAIEKDPDRLTNFAKALQPVRPDLAEVLNAHAHLLAQPSTSLAGIAITSQPNHAVGPSQAVFARKLSA